MFHLLYIRIPTFIDFFSLFLPMLRKLAKQWAKKSTCRRSTRASTPPKPWTFRPAWTNSFGPRRRELLERGRRKKSPSQRKKERGGVRYLLIDDGPNERSLFRRRERRTSRRRGRERPSFERCVLAGREGRRCQKVEEEER